MEAGRRLVVGCLLVLALGGCAATPRRMNVSQPAPPSRTRGLKDAAQMQQVVDTLVPSGTSLAQAEQLMRGEGFECTFGHNDETNQDYLLCVRADSNTFWISTRWIVTLTYRDGAVFQSHVKSGLVGP